MQDAIQMDFQFQDSQTVEIRTFPSGAAALFLVESENILQLDALCGFFQNLERYYRTQKLCEGQLVAYALQTTRRSAYSFAEILRSLQRHFRSVHQVNHLDLIAYHTVQQLADQFSCRFSPLPLCKGCASPLFFPAAQTLTMRGPVLLSTNSFCQPCFSNCPGDTYAELAQTLSNRARDVLAVSPVAQLRNSQPVAACH